MGGGNSVENITKNTYDTITKTVTQAAQAQSTDINQIQTANINCTSKVLLDNKLAFSEFCIKSGVALSIAAQAQDQELKLALIAANGNTKGFTPNPNSDVSNATKMCQSSVFTCGANGVQMNAMMNSSFTTSQIQTINNTLKTSLTSALKQNATQVTGPLQFGDKTTNEIDTLIKNVTDTVTKLNQTMLNSSSQSQTFNFAGAGIASAITMDAKKTEMLSTMQNNSATTSAVNALAQKVQQVASQSSGDLTKIILAIAGGIIGVLLAVGIVLIILKIHGKNMSSMEDMTKAAGDAAAKAAPAAALAGGGGWYM